MKVRSIAPGWVKSLLQWREGWLPWLAGWLLWLAALAGCSGWLPWLDSLDALDSQLLGDSLVVYNVFIQFGHAPVW